jgi:hypothetical protein
MVLHPQQRKTCTARFVTGSLPNRSIRAWHRTFLGCPGPVAPALIKVSLSATGKISLPSSLNSDRAISKLAAVPPTRFNGYPIFNNVHAAAAVKILLTLP